MQAALSTPHDTATDDENLDSFYDARKADSLGYQAGQADHRNDSNPYDPADSNHWFWLRGWVAARHEKHLQPPPHSIQKFA
jgi:ribosome modulation factor